MTEKWAWVWVVRKDGWMRRIPLALPLGSEIMMHEPLLAMIRERISDDAGPVLEHEICNLRFVLQRVKNAGEHALPWAEPHFYKEV